MRNSSSSFSISSGEAPHRENIVVGLSEDLDQLKERLTARQTNFEIIPIVGMGGIGKTTLARNLYDDPLIVSYFDKRGWITISQGYDLKELLLNLLRCLVGNLTDEMIGKEVDKLILQIHQTLWGRRYLIVLDDMWSSKAWDDIRMWFSDSGEGSWILVTTREISVANYVDSQCLYHQVNFLNDVKSWNLLCKKVFVEETCPPELVEVGKKIAKDCAGLPLAIHLVGGLLAQRDRNQQFWQYVANDVGSIVASKDEKLLNILSLSYYNLPNHLRPCFLYMGLFPEDYEIRRSKLIWLWVAEGFIKPILGSSLEEAAELYLKGLVDRNLLLVYQEEVKGNVKIYIMHDLLRDLCITKAYEERFFIGCRDDITRWIGSYDDLAFRRHCIYNYSENATWFSPTRGIRSFQLFGEQRYPMYVLEKLFISMFIFRTYDLKLIRVLDILRLNSVSSVEPLLELVNLRYLAFWSKFLSFNWMSTFYNLQTIIISHWGRDDVRLATETIINMPRLRHIQLLGIYPSLDLPRMEDVAPHGELQTLSTVAIDESFAGAILAFPNLKKLGVIFDGCRDYARKFSTIDLTYLTKLETLKGSWRHPLGRFPLLLIFPPSLKKLTLEQCKILLGCRETIGALPNLEVLKVRICEFRPTTWEPIEGQFCKLRLLLLEKVDLVNWKADETHYPRLERLIIRDCPLLEEIPLDIGEIPTLQTIEVHGPRIKPSHLDSARRIQDEQLELGNDLQVRIIPS